MFDVPNTVLFGAILVASAIPILWWAVSAGAKSPPSMEHRLRVPDSLDLRDIVLQQSAAERVVRPGFSTLAHWARSVSPSGFVDRLERKIGHAGLRSTWPLERTLATKVMLGVGLGLLGVLRWLLDPSSTGLLALAAVLAILGFVLPDMLIGIQGDKRQKEIARSLPDVLDQIMIAVEAGLGFEAALGYVSQDVTTPLAEELSHTLQDIRVGLTRAQAFESLMRRTDVPELRQFVVALQQAEKMGIPIAKVLRIQAAELRVIRRQTAEEDAQKLPVKLIMPLILCILPALIVVVLAPAAFDAIDTFS
ncbi:MAG: type II secretion system F family protein [Acidimicrobiales bacterium]|nr:type II secretion system F family protein [Acidimicrobiales bacterium]